MVSPQLSLTVHTSGTSTPQPSVPHPRAHTLRLLAVTPAQWPPQAFSSPGQVAPVPSGTAHRKWYPVLRSVWVRSLNMFPFVKVSDVWVSKVSLTCQILLAELGRWAEKTPRGSQGSSWGYILGPLT